MQILPSGAVKPSILGGGLLVLGLLGTSAYSLLSLNHEHRRSEELAASNQTLNTSLRQTRGELQAMSEKINALAAEKAAAIAPAPVARRSSKAQPATPVARRRAAAKSPDDPRWSQMQAKLTDQEKEIAATRDSIAHTRDDLQGKLDSTRDDLNGSIARNHEELVALQKRGERNFYEFQLDKSKQTTRVGPISLSLRKVNTKHRYYDLVMTVDDQQLEKKHVNLYEPLMLNLADRPQPIELVVNQINRNQVKGYVSEPKYRKSELAASAVSASTAQVPAATPASNDAKALQRR